MSKKKRKRCQAINREGDQCKNYAQPGSDYCWVKKHQAQANKQESLTKKNDHRAADWERNHKIVHDTYLSLMQIQKSAPTLTKVAEECGLSRQTVTAHIDRSTLQEKIERTGLKILTEDVLLGIANAAKKGSAANAKLWLQVVEGWEEGKKLTIDDKRGEFDKLSEKMLGFVEDAEYEEVEEDEG